VSSSFPILKERGLDVPAILPRLAFWSACLFVFVLAALPRPPKLPGSPSDIVLHIAAFVGLATLGHWAYSALKKRYLLAGLALFGALIEAVQAIPMVNRDSDPLDWFVDVGAALTVFVIAAAWSHLRSRRNVRIHSR
jgi:hypothetical protein